MKRKEIETFFAEKDRDFDGRLSLEEFLGEETQIEKLFRLMDKNADGEGSQGFKLTFYFYFFQDSSPKR